MIPSVRMFLHFLGLVLLFSQTSPAAVIDFEAFPDSTILTNQYSGVTFTNAIILTAGISLNEFEFPPLSGSNVASDNGGPMSIDFSSPVLSFGGYFTYLEPLTVTALDGSDDQLATASSLFSNNLACLAGPPCSGDPGSSPNEFIQVSSAAGISSVTITGDPAGGSFTLDDATITALPNSGVPEPSTVLLFLSGIAALAAFRKQNCMKTPMIVGVAGAGALLLGGVWLIAAPQATPPPNTVPTIGNPIVTPPVINTNTPTNVTVTATITDSRLIPGSVNLLRIASTNPQPTIVGVMHDDGLQGDVVAGDHVYTLQLTLDEQAQGAFNFQVSAAFTGLLRRVLSPTSQFAIINPAGASLVDIAAPSTAIVFGVVTAQHTLTDSGGAIVTDLTLAVNQVLKGSNIPPVLSVRLLGGILDGAYSFSPGTPIFTTGETVVLLLTGPDPVSGLYSVQGLALGVFHIRSSPSLGQIAVVDSGYSDLDAIQSRNATFQAFLTQSASGQVTLPELYSALGVSP